MTHARTIEEEATFTGADNVTIAYRSWDLLNDIGREAVIADILEWIGARLPASKSST